MEANIYNFFKFLENKTGNRVPLDLEIEHSTPEQIVQMYRENPELFKKRKHKKILRGLGIDVPTNDMWFELEMSPSDITYYVDGDWTVRQYTDARGNKRKQGMFETLLSGDYWELFENGGDWESALYYTDDENTGIMWDLIKGFTNPEEIEGKSLKELLEEFDNDYEIRHALSNAMSSVESDSYYDYYMKVLRNALGEYGEVTKLNDDGATIKINLQDIIDKEEPAEVDLDEMFERCEDDAECVFRELLGNYYDKPDFRVDDRWTPDINERNFNDVLNDYLGDVRM
jgi:hypothetical protein